MHTDDHSRSARFSHTAHLLPHRLVPSSSLWQRDSIDGAQCDRLRAMRCADVSHNEYRYCLHLVRGGTSTGRLRQYFSYVRHIDLDLDDPLWKRLGMQDVYDLFDEHTFPQLQSVSWDMGNITRRTTPIAEHCLASPGAPSPSLITTYTTTYILDVFIGSIWPVNPLYALPAKWLSANYPVPASSTYVQHEKRIDLQLNCNWGDHSDTPEAWDYFKTRLTEILQGPIVNLHIICPSGQMLERIADVMTNLHSYDHSRLPLQSMCLTFEHFQQMHLLISRRVLEALKSCAPELKVVIQKEAGRNIERFDDLASILIYAEHITHLELQMPFDLLEQPRITGREVDIDNRHPVEDIAWPEYHGSLTRKRMSHLSGIRRITFCARGRGSVHYDRVQTALSTRPAIEGIGTCDLDDLRTSPGGRYAFAAADDSDSDFSDLELECQAEDQWPSKRAEYPSTSRRLPARSISSSDGARAGPSSLIHSNGPADVAICTSASMGVAIPPDIDTTIALSEEELESAQTAEFQRASYNLRAISAIFAILGEPDVQVDIAPIDHAHESEYNLPSTFQEYPLEHWFEGTEYTQEGEMGMGFVERFVRVEVGAVQQAMA